MLAVNSFSEDGVITTMESLTEQDIVEQCVIVHGGAVSSTPEVDLEVEVEPHHECKVDPDHHGGMEQDPSSSSSPPPPPQEMQTVSTLPTTTRIVYSHSARLGGQLVTVLTHAPPEDHPHSHSSHHHLGTTHLQGLDESNHRLVVVVPTQQSSGSGATTTARIHSILKPGDSHHHPTVLVHTSPQTDPGYHPHHQTHHHHDLDSDAPPTTEAAEDLSTSNKPVSLATLTVIVPPSSSSQKLSGGGGEEDHHQQTGQDTEDEDGGMICDGTEFRLAPQGHGHHSHLDPHSHSQHHSHPHHSSHHHQVVTVVGYPNSSNGRLSPGDNDYSNPANIPTTTTQNSAGQYATLTPLQPLPPISTMTDKFTYAPQYNGVMGGLYSGSYENVKLMSPPSQHHHYASSPTNGLSPPSGNYQGGGGGGGGSSSSGGGGNGGVNGMQQSPKSPNSGYEFRRGQSESPSPHQQHHVNVSFTQANNNNGLSPHSSHSSPPLTAVVVAHRDANSPNSSSLPHIVTKSVSMVTTTATPAGSGASSSAGSTTSQSASGGGGELEEINTKELAARISAELKRYSIPQAIFAQRVLCRSQGTLSDLLRNPKPWSKLKSGRETFRRMWKWLQEPEFQRMSALRLAGKQSSCGYSGSSSSTSPSSSGLMGPPHTVSSSSPAFGQPGDHHAFDVQYYNHHSTQLPPTSSRGFTCNSNTTACKRKEEQQTTPEHPPTPKKPRLVFTDLQRRTLQAIFKETKRPSKEMQVTIARQLGLEPTTVGNFFMNARRRSMDKWKEENEPSPKSSNNSNASATTPNGVHPEDHEHEHEHEGL